jgi:nitrogen-specific signal transduction histidine kinase
LSQFIGMMYMKGLRTILLIAAVVFFVLFLSLVIINEFKYNVIRDVVADHGMPIILLCIVGILFFAFLAGNCLLSKRDLSNQNKSLQNLRKKIACITANDSIVIMQYDVKNQEFIRWDETTGKEFRHFTLNNYWKYIHDDDLYIAQNLINHMNSHQTKPFVCEYRYLFPGAKEYSWQLNEIFPFEIDSDGLVTSYLGICHKNNEYHRLSENIERYRKRVAFTSQSNIMGFVQYDVATDTFSRLDSAGERPDMRIAMNHWFDCIFPDDMALGVKLLNVLRERKLQTYSTEFRYRYPKDAYNWFSINVTAYDYDADHQITSYMLLCRKNNEWHEMLDKLESYKNKVSFISSLSGIIFADFDTQTGILHCLNGEGGFKDYSFNLEEYMHFMHPDDRSKGEQVVKMMKERTMEHFHTEYRFSHPWEKEYIWYSVDIAATSYDADHKVTVYTWLNRNNNAWHKAMDEMLELQGKAKLASMQSSFLSNINHEIRTPLNAIVGFSNIMCDEDSYEERARYRDIIDNNNQKLLRIVDDVLMLSKIESDDINFKYTTVDIADFFKKLIDKIRPLVGPNVQLICKCDKPLTSTLDVTYLKNVTSALLNNAIKFTHEGSITLDYAAKDGGLYVSVTDTGIGIAQEEQERIFERFEKVDSFKEGTGIGLPICKAILTKVNGKIGVESQLGKGSTFWYWVPRKTSES